MQEINMEKTNIAGIEIAYERWGRGVPLVLIHGYPLDHTIWKEVIPLLESGFDLIVPDLRGFGESGLREADSSILDFASDIADLLTQLKIKHAILAGHSMGGYVGLAFARVYPERVSGLGLISSQLRADTPEGKAGRYETARQVMDKGVGSVVEAMTPKLSAAPRVQAFVRELISKQKPLALSNALTAMAERPDSTDLAKTFKFPMLVVHGDSDALIPVDRGREVKALLPNAHYAELPKLGHMTMIENPQAVAEALRFFLKSNA
jgi:pimeloyl-ACP methyl ester carboxylesterase